MKGSDIVRTTRRSFLETVLGGSAAVCSATLFPGRVLGANERLNIGVIGVGGRGAGNLAAIAEENIVALCDVDATRLGVAAEKWPAAKKFADYRELLDMEGLDAVLVSTPDHHHAPATVRALKRGLHVYCEKPLTHTIQEARLLDKLAAEKKLVTQMGTQNHQHPGYLRTVELLQKNAIGPVKEVHIITDRPGRFWPQGLEKPTNTPKKPDDLSWDLWLGPAAMRPYHSAYVPFKWRAWWDFGCGAIGDMAIHLMDPSYWALELGGPVKVTSEGPAALPDCGPKWMKSTFEFGARGNLPPCKIIWYEGEVTPPKEIADELPMNGSLFIGEEGRLAVQHNGDPVLLPKEKFADYKGPEPYLEKSPGHHQQWINACKAGDPSAPGSRFSYAAPFTEIVLLGNIAHRIGETIEYDPKQGKITNIASANQYLGKEYRKGWELE